MKDPVIPPHVLRLEALKIVLQASPVKAYCSPLVYLLREADEVYEYIVNGTHRNIYNERDPHEG